MNQCDFVLAIKNGIVRKVELHGFSGLSDIEKTVELVSSLDFEVTQGGLRAYYQNSSGDHANDVIPALEQVHAFEAARILKHVNSLFPGGAPARERLQRLEALSDMAEDADQCVEKATAALDERADLDDLITQFILRHRDEFLRIGYTLASDVPKKPPERCSLTFLELAPHLHEGMPLAELRALLNSRQALYGVSVPADQIVKYTIRLKTENLRLETDMNGRILSWSVCSPD